MKVKISNEEIVERVMRMGIEFRSGLSIDELHDLAKSQLTKQANTRSLLKKSQSFEDWQLGAMPPGSLRYGLLRIDNYAQIVKVSNPKEYMFVRWVTPGLPEIALCQ